MMMLNQLQSWEDEKRQNLNAVNTNYITENIATTHTGPLTTTKLRICWFFYVVLGGLNGFHKEREHTVYITVTYSTNTSLLFSS